MIGIWNLLDTAKLLDARLDGKNATYSRIVTDSRDDCSQAIFIALTGENFDGHNFVGQAKEKGAASAIVNKNSSCTTKEFARIEVNNTLEAYGKIAAENRRRFTQPVVGITGSAGKTTVSKMLASICSKEQATHVTKANHNNEIGVCQTLLSISKEHEIAIVEMGARIPGDITWLCNNVLPTTAIITNIGHSHLSTLGSIENVAKEKSSIFKQQPLYAIAPAVDVKKFQLFGDLDNKTTTVVWGSEAECQSVNATKKTIVKNCQCNSDTSSATLILPQTDNIQTTAIDITLPLSGKHQLHNAAAAATAAWLNGISSTSIIEGLNSFTPQPGRQQSIKLHNFLLLLDSYNANPASTKASVDALSLYSPRPLAIAFGDMLELGRDEIELHQQTGKFIAQKGIKALFTLGNLAHEAGQSYKIASQGQGEWQSCDSHQNLASAVIDWLNNTPGAVILIKGSRGKSMETLAVALQKYYNR